MGAYVEPPNEPIEDFLTREGKLVPLSTAWADVPAGHFPVVLVFNEQGGPGLTVTNMDTGETFKEFPNAEAFTAAAIAFDEREFDRFRRPWETRKRLCFLVPIEKLHPVSPALKMYMGKK